MSEIKPQGLWKSNDIDKVNFTFNAQLDETELSVDPPKVTAFAIRTNHHFIIGRRQICDGFNMVKAHKDVKVEWTKSYNVLPLHP